MGASVARVLDEVPFTPGDLPGYAGRLFDFLGANPGLLRLATWHRLERADTGHEPAGLSDSYGVNTAAVAHAQTDHRLAAAIAAEDLAHHRQLPRFRTRAGYANSAPIEEMADDDSRAQLQTNLFGVVNDTRAALPVFHKQRSGHFLQLSSIGGRVGGTPGLGVYQTAKFAVEGFSEVLNAEVKSRG